MKKNILFWTLSIAASFILTAGLLAQEQGDVSKDQVHVSIKVTKDGKVIKDTTYQFDDASEAKHAVKMMEVLSGDEEHMENIHYNYTTAHSGSGNSRAMVFISEDGETTEIKEFHGDSNVWVTEEESDGEHVKVIKYKIEEGDDQPKKVIVMESEDGNTIDILVDEDHEGGDVVKTKEIRVMVSGDEKANWTVVEGDEKMIDKDENVYIIEGGDDMKVEMKKILEEHDGEEGARVKVIVIKEDMDHDEDYDEDSDHDEDVEVKVIKKEKKQKK